MSNYSQNTKSYQNESIDLLKLFKRLFARKLLILIFTFVSSLVVFLYLQNNDFEIYKSEILFTLPKEIQVNKINNINKTIRCNDEDTNQCLNSESRTTIFNKLLFQLMSEETHRMVFQEDLFLNKYKELLSPNNSSNSLFENTTFPATKLEAIQGDFGPLNQPLYKLSIFGANSEFNEDYLSELLNQANSIVIDDITSLTNFTSSDRSQSLSNKRSLLIEAAKKKRLIQIKRIEETDAQQMREINDEINNAIFVAQTKLLNEIAELEEYIELSKFLGITENSFNNMDDNTSENAINILTNSTIPEWYLYGEKALTKKLQLLKNRSKDSTFNLEVLTLKNLLKEVKNNSQLETLKMRTDDSLMINGIIQIDIEANQLQLSKENTLNLDNINFYNLIKKHSFKERSNKNTILFSSVALFLMIGILLALLMDVLKPYKETNI